MPQENNMSEAGENLNDYINADAVDINPLDESVNEKSYARPNISVSQETLNKPIPEPSFSPPPIDFSKPPMEEAAPKAKREPMNPEMAQLGKKDKEMASEVLAKMILDGYSLMHVLANKGLTISEKKLMKMQQDGEINLGAEIEYEYGKKIRANDFFEQYNRQAETTLSVSDEFKEEVTPVLQTVLEKRGLGLTPEQQLGYIFAKDIAGKAFIFMSMKGQLNNMIEVIKEATTANPMSKKNAPRSAAPPPEPQAAAEPTPPPPPPPPTQADDSGFKEPVSVSTTQKGSGTKVSSIVIKDIPPAKKRGRKTIAIN